MAATERWQPNNGILGVDFRLGSMHWREFGATYRGFADFTIISQLMLSSFVRLSFRLEGSDISRAMLIVAVA